MFPLKLSGKVIEVTNIDYVSIVNGCELNSGYRFATIAELEELYRTFKFNFEIFTFGKSGGKHLKVEFKPTFQNVPSEEETSYTVGSDGESFQLIYFYPKHLCPCDGVLHTRTPIHLKRK